jgi:hypothetical protein
VTARVQQAALDASRVLATARRILVIGCPGSGKTTFAHRLGAMTGVPVVSLDDHYFSPGWRQPEPGAWAETVRALTAAPEWIIDGNHLSTLSARLAQAEAVVLLDLPPVLCLARYARRLARYTRADYQRLPEYMRLGSGRRKTADRPLRFACFILSFRHQTLPAVQACLEAQSAVPIVRVGDRAAMTRLLSRLAQGYPQGADTC